MAQNDEPDHSSSSKEETSSSDSDEVSDTDSGKKPKPEPKKSLTPHQAFIIAKYSNLFISDESDSDSDSDSPSKKSAVNDSSVNPISSKPMEQNPDSKLVKKDGSKTISTATQSPAAPAEVEKTAKKAKHNTANRKIKRTAVSSSKSARKSQGPDLSALETEDSSSGYSSSDTDSPPKKSAAAVSNVKPMSSKPIEQNLELVEKDRSNTILTATQSPAKSKRPPAAPAEVEKVAKKAKQNTANSNIKRTAVSSSKSARKSRARVLSPSDSNSSGYSSAYSSGSKRVKPIFSKPMESKSAKKRGTETVSMPPRVKIKPPAPPMNETAAKNNAQDEDSTKQWFQRRWSEDDEIAVLEGMISYKKETGENPAGDAVAFHEFIKKSLHVDVSRTQLVDKMRRLRKKYENNASKDRSFSKIHEQKGYELSKLIWGSNNGTERKNTRSKKNRVDDKDRVTMEGDKNVDVSRFVRYGGRMETPVMLEETVMAGLELVDGSKRFELEMKWRRLKEQELELYAKRMELLREQALVVLEAVRSSGK